MTTPTRETYPTPHITQLVVICNPVHKTNHNSNMLDLPHPKHHIIGGNMFSKTYNNNK